MQSYICAFSFAVLEQFDPGVGNLTLDTQVNPTRRTDHKMTEGMGGGGGEPVGLPTSAWKVKNSKLWERGDWSVAECSLQTRI